MDVNIADALRAHWKRFIWMWAFPFVLLSSIFLPAFERYPSRIFFGIHLPLLLVCSYIASSPVRHREVSFWHGFVLLIAFPFLIWTALVLTLFGLEVLLRALVD